MQTQAQTQVAARDAAFEAHLYKCRYGDVDLIQAIHAGFFVRNLKLNKVGVAFFFQRLVRSAANGDPHAVARWTEIMRIGVFDWRVLPSLGFKQIRKMYGLILETCRFNYHDFFFYCAKTLHLSKAIAFDYRYRIDAQESNVDILAVFNPIFAEFNKKFYPLTRENYAACLLSLMYAFFGSPETNISDPRTRAAFVRGLHNHVVFSIMREYIKYLARTYRLDDIFEEVRRMSPRGWTEFVRDNLYLGRKDVEPWNAKF